MSVEEKWSTLEKEISTRRDQVINLIQELRSGAGKNNEAGSGAGDLETKWDIPMTEVWKRLGFYLGLIVILYAGIGVIGYPLSMILFIVLFYRSVAKASWPASLVAGAAGLGFLALTSKVLDMEWPQGLISLPWPLG